MSDLLGSILNSMDKHKPPQTGDKEKQMMKKQKHDLEKRQAREKERLKKFREKIENDMNKFIQDPDKQKIKFDTMDKVGRQIVHDVADIAGLTAFSFGEDEVDRYVMIFKKEFAPSDDELQAYRNGEEWNVEKAKEVARLKQLKKEEEENDQKSAKEESSNPVSSERLEKRMGREAAKDAERIITPNRQFGFVSSENKKDQRSIEQTLADIRARKKQKTEQTVAKDDSHLPENV